MVFSSIIFKRDDGFGAKRWYFFELIAKRFDAFIRHSRVQPVSWVLSTNDNETARAIQGR